MSRRDQQDPTHTDRDNRSRQLDPEHDAYGQSRGEQERPQDWRDRIQADEPRKSK
jgi:hypothetical protein